MQNLKLQNNLQKGFSSEDFFEKHKQKMSMKMSLVTRCLNTSKDPTKSFSVIFGPFSESIFLIKQVVCITHRAVDEVDSAVHSELVG